MGPAADGRLAVLPYQIAQQYIAELVAILEYLRNKSVAHRDLKPENCLLDHSMHLKLTDFGAAKRCPVTSRSEEDEKAKTKAKVKRGTFVGTQE